MTNYSITFDADFQKIFFFSLPPRQTKSFRANFIRNYINNLDKPQASIK